MKTWTIISFFINIIFLQNLTAQKNISGHSHNDYVQKRPFRSAFEAQMGSIEADVFLVKNNLYVSHEAKDIKEEYTLDGLYLKPLLEAIQAGKIYPMVLLIDIKSQADSTLDVIVQQISRYPAFLKNDCLVKFIVSGNRPKPEKWSSYPDFIQFDGRPTENYTQTEWKRVGIVSDSFEKYLTTDNNKNINQETYNKMKTVVQQVHEHNKKMRFWATPDKKRIWKTLAQMGVDFINTDSPRQLRKFLNKNML